MEHYFVSVKSTAVNVYSEQALVDRWWTKEQFDEFLNDHENVDIMFSSSMDFPQEYTDNAEVLGLVNYINSRV